MTSSQNFESYLPVYDTVPDKWEDARPFFVENLKKISNAVNIREIGWFLNEEVISGKQFIPLYQNRGENVQYRTIFRKVVDCSPIAIGVNNFAHEINFDTSFTLIQLFGAATNSGTLVAVPLPNDVDSLSLTATNIVINSTAVYDRVFVTIEYILEV